MPELKVALLVAVMCLLLVNINGQLTFTPSWGKRANDPGAASLVSVTAGGSPSLSSMYTASSSSENNCKTSMDSLLLIYRLIQTEAQRILACNGK